MYYIYIYIYIMNYIIIDINSYVVHGVNISQRESPHRLHRHQARRPWWPGSNHRVGRARLLHGEIKASRDYYAVNPLVLY